MYIIATLGLNLDSKSKLCSEEPEWDLKSLLTNPPTHLLGSWIFFWILNPWCFVLVCPHLSCLSRHLCLSPPFMYVPRFMSVPTYFVCPNLLCLSPPIMYVPTFYVCPHQSCLSPPIIFFADKPFLNLECLEYVFLTQKLILTQDFLGLKIKSNFRTKKRCWLHISFQLIFLLLKLARAVGVPVGRRSGGRLATTLVATKNVFIFFLFFFPPFFFFFVVTFSHRRSARIKKLM